MSTFYVVSTPIGNLEDITLRALSVLKEVDLILCEDTRTTKILLNKYEIQKDTMSYHTKSSITKIDDIIALLDEGKNIALVSDAGTPCISDPGVLLVQKIREHIVSEKNSDDSNLDSNSNIKIITIPGPSALISALSVSGLPSSDFTFYGFLPHKKGRETIFKEISESEKTVAFYESPHRIIKTLESLAKFVPERKIVIARELTKIFEETPEGTAHELLEYFSKNTDKIRGEFVVMVAGL